MVSQDDVHQQKHMQSRSTVTLTSSALVRELQERMQETRQCNATRCLNAI